MENFEQNVEDKDFNKYIVAVVILILLIVGGFYLWTNYFGTDTKEKIDSANIPEPSDVPTLEEIAEEQGKDISEFLPEPSDIPTLEEIAEEQGKDVADFIPAPSNIPPLEF